ncbi:hypothetical protein [Antrihabitans stalactiti]|uniref:Uncharacterized protein n=1 Tax=Antrihabitans stalactiti TaxID=2584121 RepID=A0A848KKV0_9NOCA|nr:hypothetical protein [Antrihabitans stalactiti]NMN98476.1 hypothetical protein [Antrihabitans stalactiti]
MSDAVDTKAEIIKLSRVLGEDVAALEFLETIGWRQLREFRYLVADQFFEGAESRLKNLAAAAKLVPNPIIVKLAPIYFEPRLAAGVAGLVDEEKALKLVPKLPVSLMAETLPYVDPRKIGQLVSKVPVDVARKLLPVMIASGEYISMGQLVDFVTPEQLAGVLPILDDVSLLRIAEVTENKDQFDIIIPLIDDARIARVIQTAREENLLDVAIELLNEVNVHTRGRMANIAAQQSDKVLNALVEAVDSAGEWDMLLPTTRQMTPQNLARFAKAKALDGAEVMSTLVESAVRNDVWDALLPMVPHLSDAGLSGLASVSAFQDRAVVAKVVNEAVGTAQGSAALFASALPLISRVSEQVKRVFADEIGKLDPATFEREVKGVVAAGKLSDLLPLVSLLPKPKQDAVSTIAANFDPTEMHSALVAASDNGVLPEMLEVAAGMPLDKREQAIGIITDNEDDDLLGTTLEPDQQQNVWNQVLKLSSNVPLPALQRLSDQAAFLNLENVLPSVMQAAEFTNEWNTGLAILGGIHDRARKDGVPVQVTVQGRLVQKAAEKALEAGLLDKAGLGKDLLEQYAKEQGIAKEFDETVLLASGAARGAATQVVQMSFGAIEDGVSPIRALADQVPGGKSVAGAVSEAAGKASGLASSLFERAKAATHAVTQDKATHEGE